MWCEILAKLGIVVPERKSYKSMREKDIDRRVESKK